MENETRNTLPIGVFDSGVGGLTVAREIVRQLPAERLVYFGDTARVPYGSKSKDTIVRYAEQIVRFLLTKEVKAIVIACNTASALALEEVQGQVEIPVIGVVEPGARAAVQVSEGGKIGVIGTRGTVKSGMYPQVIRKLDASAEVLAKACPLFVPLVEEGLTGHQVTGEMIDYYLSDLKTSGITSLILGCTHYPLLRSRIMEYMGEGIALVNPAYETAMELKALLERQGIQACGSESVQGHEFYVSDLAEQFREFADSILPFAVETTRCIPIEEY